MHRLLVLYPPPTDPDHFRSYYQDTHLPLVAKLPGLRGHRSRFDVAAAEGESLYFCVFGPTSTMRPRTVQRCSPRGSGGARARPDYATGGAVVLNYELRAAEPPGWTTARTASGLVPVSPAAIGPGKRHGDSLALSPDPDTLRSRTVASQRCCK